VTAPWPRRAPAEEHRWHLGAQQAVGEEVLLMQQTVDVGEEVLLMQLVQALSVQLLLFLTVMLLRRSVLLFSSVLQLRLAEHWSAAGELTGTLEAAESLLKPAAPGGRRLLLPMVAARRG